MTPKPDRGKLTDRATNALIAYWAETAAMSASLSAQAIARNELDEAMALLNQARMELMVAMGYRGAYKPYKEK